MGTVTAICISRQRGTRKEPIETAELEADYGILGDAHAGKWHRQVSLLQQEKVDDFCRRGGTVTPGAFGENLLVSGIDFRSLPVGTRLRCGEVLLEMTQIGKECHTHCAIYHQTEDCIMPREGVFAKVVQGGMVSVGDTMEIEPRETPLPWQAAVITLSDQGAAGLREDKSGSEVAERLRQNGYEVIEQLLLPDDRARLEKELTRLCDQRQPDLILTTGGTGFSARDITPEATLAVAERNVPGIAEAIRASSMQITKRAMLSRAVSVLRGRTLIVNLPGSPKACMESMDVFLEIIPHGLGLLRGSVHDCARA